MSLTQNRSIDKGVGRNEELSGSKLNDILKQVGKRDSFKKKFGEEILKGLQQEENKSGLEKISELLKKDNGKKKISEKNIELDKKDIVVDDNMDTVNDIFEKYKKNKENIDSEKKEKIREKISEKLNNPNKNIDNVKGVVNKELLSLILSEGQHNKIEKNIENKEINSEKMEVGLSKNNYLAMQNYIFDNGDRALFKENYRNEMSENLKNIMNNLLLDPEFNRELLS